MSTTVLRLPEVMHRVGFSRSAIYKLVARNLFPKPINIGVRAVAWLESDVETWLAAKIEDSRASQPAIGTDATT